MHIKHAQHGYQFVMQFSVYFPEKVRGRPLHISQFVQARACTDAVNAKHKSYRAQYGAEGRVASQGVQQRRHPANGRN